MAENSAIPLGGDWRAHAADPELARTFTATDAPDDTWPNVRVPHDSRERQMLYRHRFAYAVADAARVFLEFDGRADIWLDGEYLGATEGMLAPNAFEITTAARARDHHVLALEARGLAVPPRIVTTGPVRIAEARIRCVEASVELGRLACDLVLDAGTSPHEARLRATVRGPHEVVLLETTRDTTLAAGANELAWSIVVDAPPRWWPRALGPQPLCSVELSIDVDAKTSDVRRFRTGFREVRTDHLRFSVNGERMFLKGACYGGDGRPADLQLAIDANLDFLRVYRHVAPNAFYDAADAAGILLWQDVPRSGVRLPRARRRSTREARAIASRLEHHPSVLFPGRAREETELWFGWRRGTMFDLARTVRTMPRLGRFVSAFGGESVSGAERVEDFHALGSDELRTRVPPGDAKSFDEWRDATQTYQAALLQLQIEDLRRCAGRPTGGFAVFTIVDAQPSVGYGLFDVTRTPKRAFTAVRDACRPVLPMVDPRTGNVHVANDASATLADAEIEVAVDGWTRRWRGDVDAGTVAYVGRVDVADAVDVEVVLSHPQTGRVANRYPLVLLNP